ncbi:MAG TPA: nuclear transport factor 2 family protein [Candidatus Limnocylindrales bacterium]
MSAGDDLAAIERERLRALVEIDLDRAAELHADDFQLVTPSGRVLSKAEYLEAVRTRAIAYALWEAGEIEVRRHDDAAMIRYRSEMAFTVDGARTPRRRFWHTDLYERRDGRWQVVWSQATEIRGPERPEA